MIHTGQCKQVELEQNPFNDAQNTKQQLKVFKKKIQGLFPKFLLCLQMKDKRSFFLQAKEENRHIKTIPSSAAFTLRRPTTQPPEIIILHSAMTEPLDALVGYTINIPPTPGTTIVIQKRSPLHNRLATCIVSHVAFTRQNVDSMGRETGIIPTPSGAMVVGGPSLFTSTTPPRGPKPQRKMLEATSTRLTDDRNTSLRSDKKIQGRPTPYHRCDFDSCSLCVTTPMKQLSEKASEIVACFRVLLLLCGI